MAVKRGNNDSKRGEWNPVKTVVSQSKPAAHKEKKVKSKRC